MERRGSYLNQNKKLSKEECDSFEADLEGAYTDYYNYLGKYTGQTSESGSANDKIAKAIDSSISFFDISSGAAGISFPGNSTVNYLGNLNTAVNLVASTGKVFAGLSEPGNMNLVQEGVFGIGITTANFGGSVLLNHVAARSSISFSFGRASVSTLARGVASRGNPYLFAAGIGIGLTEYNFTARDQAAINEMLTQGILDSGQISAGYREKYNDLKKRYEEGCPND